MNYLESFELFERKGNYQLFHKTSALSSILKDGFIIAGGSDEDSTWWNVSLRKNVFPNWKKDDTRFKTISATRNLNYMGLPALELDVEKISDKYKIVPFSENPDFYLDFTGDNWNSDEPKVKYTPQINKNLDRLENMLRTKEAGHLYWRHKLKQNMMDFGIAEELILTDKLDISKYVKRIILDKYDKDYKKIIKKKYPQIEVVVLDGKRGYSDFGYSDIKKAIKDKEKKLVYQESINVDNDEYDIGDWVEYAWSQWSFKEEKMKWFDEIGEIIVISNEGVDYDIKVKFNGLEDKGGWKPFTPTGMKDNERWIRSVDIIRKLVDSEVSAIKYNL